LISFLNAKIRSDVENPHFNKNIDKIQNLLLEELKSNEKPIEPKMVMEMPIPYKEQHIVI
jgi:hypothetical protein